MDVRRIRPASRTEWVRLAPFPGRSWLDLARPTAPDGVRMVYALLDAGYLEAWRDGAGHVRLRPATLESA
ncbi:MAG: hypothetical protein WC876_04335 [Candidatus Thermoplasmatota archaeon]|jgi:hypothetical protein